MTLAPEQSIERAYAPQAVATRRARGLLSLHWPIVLILIAFLVLATLYGSTTPPFEAPNETSHWSYVVHLARGQGLPPLVTPGELVTQGSAHHPPLYYAIGALLIGGIDTGPAEDAYVRNPYASLGAVDAFGNKNAVLHPQAGDAQTERVMLALRLLRGLSVLCSAATILLVYYLAREVMPHRLAVAAGAASLVAFNPQFLFVGSAAGNEPLAALIATLVLCLLLRASRRVGDPIRTAVLVGLVTGLAMLTKASLTALLLLVPLGYAIDAYRRRSDRILADIAGPVAIATAVALAVAGWWYVRNAVQYQDPFGLRAMQALAGAYARPLSPVETLRRLALSVVSYWGVFGWNNIPADEAYYVLVRITTALGVVGAVLAVVGRLWRRPSGDAGHWDGILLTGAWMFIMLLALAQFARTVADPQGYMLFPAVAGISLYLCVGLCAWVPRRYDGVLGLSLAAALLAFSAISPSRYIVPAYALPERVALEDAPTQMRDLGIAFGDEIFLLGYEMNESSVQSGEWLEVTLYWVSLRATERNLAVGVRIYGRADALIGRSDSFPGGGNYPTSLWVPGEVVFDRQMVRIAPDAVAPAAISLRVGVHDAADLATVPAMDAGGRAVGPEPEIGRVRLAGAAQNALGPHSACPALHPVQVNLGDRVVLEGYDVYVLPQADEKVLQVNLCWRRIGPLASDWTVFAHIYNAAGEFVTQFDEQPLQGDYPTSFWELDELVYDEHWMLISGALPPGQYTMQLGLYRLDTGERLQVMGDPSSLNYVVLGPAYIDSR